MGAASDTYVRPRALKRKGKAGDQLEADFFLRRHRAGTELSVAEQISDDRERRGAEADALGEGTDGHGTRPVTSTSHSVADRCSSITSSSGRTRPFV